MSDTRRDAAGQTGGEPQGARAEPEPWPGAGQAWYAVAIFAFALMFDFLDRGIVTLLVEPLKRDLVLTDTQMSLLIGFAYVCFYLVLGLPIARLVDSKSRRLIMAIGISCWSGMTAVCGLAQNFWQLFLARVGVGVGEACNGPATFSMLADLFPREKLARAIAVLNFGFVAGNGIALILGGAVLHFISKMPDIELPVLGVMRPWQLTFIAVGLPGLLMAAMMATVKEPKRRGRIAAHGAATAPGKAVPIKDVVAFLGRNRTAYVPMFLGLAISSIMSFGNQAWGPTLFIRTYGWTASEIGVVQGTLMILVAPFGLLAGARLAEWFTARGKHDANMRVLLIATVLQVPGNVLYPLMPTAEMALTVFAVTTFIRFLGPGPQNAAIQSITPNEMRGQVTALYLFVFNIVGFGFGPTFVALFTDYVFGADTSLRYAMSLGSAIAGPLAAFVMWFGLKPYGEAYARAEKWQ